MNRTVRLSFLIVVLVSVAGCSVWDSFTAYFNTYYNAKRQFTEAEDELWNQPDLKYTGRNPIVPIVCQAGQKTKFAAVIEKCSKLLQYHPESGLVENSLLMIGKAYFYQGDFQPAERKFLELMSKFPESSSALEARVLLAVSQYKMGDRGKAAETATQAQQLMEKEGEDDLEAVAAGVLGHLALDDRNYTEALKHFEVEARLGGNSERRVYSYMKIGKCYEELGNYPEAEKAYLTAADITKNYLGEVRGKIAACRMMAEQGRYDESLQTLEALRSNSNYKEFFGEIDLERGNISRDAGRIDDAVVIYRTADTMYQRTDWQARVLYELGTLYQDTLGLYDSARVAFNKAKGSYLASPIMPEITRHADNINRYFTLRREITRYDSILALLKAPPDTSAKAVVPVKTDSSAGKAVQQDSTVRKPPAPPPMSRDSVESRLSSAITELATVFYLSIGNTDSAKGWYVRVAREFPEGKSTPRALYALAQIYDRDSVSGAGVGDSLRKELVARFPDSEFADEARRLLGLPVRERVSDPAEALFRQAERDLLSREFEKAREGYRTVADSFPASPYAARAQYAIGWMYENPIGNSDSAIATYTRLVERYPTTAYAARVRPLLAEVELLKKAKSSKDSLGVMPDSLEDVPLRKLNSSGPDSLGRRVQKAQPEERPIPRIDLPGLKKE